MTATQTPPFPPPPRLPPSEYAYFAMQNPFSTGTSSFSDKSSGLTRDGMIRSLLEHYAPPRFAPPDVTATSCRPVYFEYDVCFRNGGRVIVHVPHEPPLPIPSSTSIWSAYSPSFRNHVAGYDIERSINESHDQEVWKNLVPNSQCERYSYFDESLGCADYQSSASSDGTPMDVDEPEQPPSNNTTERLEDGSLLPIPSGRWFVKAGPNGKREAMCTLNHRPRKVRLTRDLDLTKGVESTDSQGYMAHKMSIDDPYPTTWAATNSYLGGTHPVEGSLDHMHGKEGWPTGEKTQKTYLKRFRGRLDAKGRITRIVADMRRRV